MSSFDNTHKRSSQALKSTLQGIYERLILSFSDSVETLHRLQAESVTRQQGNAPESAPESAVNAAAMSQAELERRIAALAGLLYTPQDLEAAVAEVLSEQGVPSQTQLLAIVDELELLNRAIDQRMEALRAAKAHAAQPVQARQPKTAKHQA